MVQDAQPIDAKPIEDRVADVEARLELATAAQVMRIEEVAAVTDVLTETIERQKRALRDGRLDDGVTFVDALASALGMSVNDVRAALVWVTQERRKAR